MKKLVVLDGHHYPEGAYAQVQDLCHEAGVDFAVLECRTPDDAVDKAQEADAALCVYLNMDGKLLEQLPRLKMVVRCGIGVDTLNLRDFTNNGVLACNVPDYGVEEVAIHALSLILSLERNIPLYNASVHDGNWNEELGCEMRRISGRTAGLLGYGRIARRLGCLLKALGYTIAAYDPYQPDDLFEEEGARRVDLRTLFSSSDVLTVMAPATAETIHIINDANLAAARHGLFIVNTARGTLIDTPALARALDSGQVAGAALDVLEEEPPLGICKILLGRKNVVLTPHVAYRSRESFAALKRMAAETALAFLLRGEVRNLVNRDVVGKTRA